MGSVGAATDRRGLARIEGSARIFSTRPRARSAVRGAHQTSRVRWRDMSYVRIQCLATGAAVAMAGTLVGPALGSTANVVTAIKTQDALVRKMPGFKVYNANLNVKTVMQAKKVVPVIGPLERASARAVGVVEKASTSSAKQRQGKAEWITGAKEENHAALEYRTALQDLISGHRSAFKSEDAKAQTLIRKGVTLSVKADRLLGISIND